MTTTHAFSLNGKIWLELNDSRQPIAERIHSILSDLDGVKKYSFMLWRMPTGKTLGEVDPAQGEEYLQCAGSAEKMTIKVRRLVDDQPEQTRALSHVTAHLRLPIQDGRKGFRVGTLEALQSKT